MPQLIFYSLLVHIQLFSQTLNPLSVGTIYAIASPGDFLCIMDNTYLLGTENKIFMSKFLGILLTISLHF